MVNVLCCLTLLLFKRLQLSFKVC